MTEPSRQPLNTSLWILQWAVAGSFHVLGLLKACVPPADLQQGLHLVARAPAALLRPVALVELAGSLAVILPAATAVLPRLTPVAAGCLAGVALLGAAMPETAGGFGQPVPNLLLAVAGVWIAWGRIAWAPIAPLGLREATRIDEQRAAAHLEREPLRAGRPTQVESRGTRVA